MWMWLEKSPTSPRGRLYLARVALLSGARRACSDYHKISRTCATRRRKGSLPCCWMLRSEKRLQQKCARIQARRTPRVERVKSPTRRPRKFRPAIGNFRTTAVGVESAARRSILVGLLKAYPCVRTVARPEELHRGTSPRRIEDFTGTDAAFAGFSAHEAIRAVSRFTMYLR